MLPEAPAPGPSLPYCIFLFLVSFSFISSCSAVSLLSVNALNTIVITGWEDTAELDLVPALPGVPGSGDKVHTCVHVHMCERGCRGPSV